MPAQPNQPLKHHPIPDLYKKVLGALQQNAAGLMNAGGDVQIVPPPSVSPNGEVARLVGGEAAQNLYVNVTAGAGDILRLLYLAEGTRVACLKKYTSSGYADVSEALTFPPFLLAPTDRGIYARVTDDDLTANVDVTGKAFDVRGPFRTAVDLDVDSTDDQVLLTADEPGQIFVPTLDIQSGIMACCAVFGDGDVPADDNPFIVQLALKNGSTRFNIAQTTVLSEEVTLLVDGPALPVLTEGWSLVAKVITPPDSAYDFAPRVLLGYQSSNASPVRTDQGGAF